MDQELANLHQERDELERSNQTLMNEFTMMNHKYVRKSCLGEGRMNNSAMEFPVLRYSLCVFFPPILGRAVD